MSLIKFFSTNGHPERVDFRAALLMGQAPDKGLYMPEEIPQIPRSRIGQFSKMSYPQIAYEVIKPYLGDLVSDSDLRAMLEDAYNYDVPVERVYDEKYVMRLDRGPTCSFKDFAARSNGPADPVLPQSRKAEAYSSSPPPRETRALLWLMPSMVWITYWW